MGFDEYYLLITAVYYYSHLLVVTKALLINIAISYHAASRQPYAAIGCICGHRSRHSLVGGVIVALPCRHAYWLLSRRE